MKIPDWARNVLAFLISLAFPGLGHYYKGHLGHFFTGLGLAFIVYLPFALGLFGYRFWVFALTIVLSYLVRIGLGVHAFRMSSNQKRWYHHIIFCGLIYWLFSTLIYYLYMSFPMKIQTFTVPTRKSPKNC